MPKRPIPNHLIGEMNPKNKEWFEEYKLWKEIKENYHDAIERFLQYHSNTKPFDIITRHNISVGEKHS